MPERSKLPMLLAVGWTLIVWGVTLLQSWMVEFSFVLAMAITAATALIGIALLIGLLVTRSWRAAAAVTLGAVAVILLPVGTLGHWGWSRISLEHNRARYETILASLGAQTSSGEREGVAYWVDAGPPRRVAFAAFHGIPDGWSAVVHDPSGTVGDLEGAAAYLFDDEIQSCIHIEGPWHRCWLD